MPLFEWRQIHQSDQLEIVHLSIEPGGTMESHTMPMDVLFGVLEGTGILSVNDIRYLLHTDELIEVPKAAMRYWRNEADFPLQILVVKSMSI
ncbi:MAG TPA: hypothetical protein DHW42_10895 [Candidatus Marinimicrobia bacterium]|nr:hypothetical protein [Candidatus Neomarinimicrobiota bacterium]